MKGLYVIVPPEDRPHGSIPAEELVPIIMKHIQAEYYVSLLSAAAFYGASHQKIFAFQVITNSRITHPLTFGQIRIKVIPETFHRAYHMPQVKMTSPQADEYPLTL